MARQKASAKCSPEAEKEKSSTSGDSDQSQWQEAVRVQEAGKQKYQRAENTSKAYAGHVARGQKWLASHFASETHDDAPGRQPSQATNGGEEVYKDPAFRDAFASVLNRCSDKALSLYLSWKGFQEGRGQSTVEGIRAAFKSYWDDA